MSLKDGASFLPQDQLLLCSAESELDRGATNTSRMGVPHTTVTCALISILPSPPRQGHAHDLVRSLRRKRKDAGATMHTRAQVWTFSKVPALSGAGAGTRLSSDGWERG